jgi:hypothetical protein
MQNRASIHYTQDELAQMDAAIAVVRALFARMIVLTADERRELVKLGPKSQAFCDQALAILLANPGIVPPSIDLEEAQADKLALDQLRPRLLALRQLMERADDTEMALGSDLLSVARDGYALLELTGKDAALKAARKELSARYARRRAAAPAAAAPEA